MASKIRIANDMLDLATFDQNALCKGYGERHGTALALAAQNGLLPIVQRLLSMGADPMTGTDECEGTVADYRAIVELLQSA